MRRECRERFPHHWLQRKTLVSDPGMHHGTCVTHVPWCMPGSLTRGGGENVPGIPGVCATCNFKYLVRGPYHKIRLNTILFNHHLGLDGHYICKHPFQDIENTWSHLVCLTRDSLVVSIQIPCQDLSTMLNIYNRRLTFQKKCVVVYDIWIYTYKHTCCFSRCLNLYHIISSFLF